MAKRINLTDGIGFTSNAADGASAVAFDFDTDAAYSTDGAKLLSLSNNGTEKAYIDKDGYIIGARFAASAAPAVRYWTGSAWFNDGNTIITAGTVGNRALILRAGPPTSISGSGWHLHGSGTDDATSYFGPRLVGTGDKDAYLKPTDQDTVANRGITNLYVLGGSANASPATGATIYGGDLNLRGGDGASGSAGQADGGNVTISGGTGYGTGSNGKVVFTDGLLSSSVADGATAVAFDFDTDNAYSTSGAKLASWSNNGTEKAYIDKDGQAVFGTGFQQIRIEDGTAYNPVITTGSSTNLVLDPVGALLVESTSLAAGQLSLAIANDGLRFGRDIPSATIDFAARAIDTAAAPISITGGAAFASATTNITGGNISITGGAGASSSAGAADGGNITLAGGTGYGTGSNGKVVFTDGLLSSSVADGATAVAFDFDTDNAYSTAGAKLLSLSNNATEKFAIDKDGIISGPSGALLASIPANTNIVLNDNPTRAYDFNNVLLGYRAGDQLNTNSDNNVFIGNTVGRFTGATGSNVGIGYNIGNMVGNNTALGSLTDATAVSATALGYESQSVHYHGFAHAGESFDAIGTGDNQFLIWQPAATTTDATPAILYMDEDAATNRMDVASGKLYAFEAHIVGVQSDGTDAAYYVRRGIIANNSGTTALIGSIQTIGTDIESNASTDVGVTADDTNDALQIQVTGVAAETWRWSANVFVKDITIGT